MEDLTQLLALAEKAALAAGRELLSWQDRFSPQEKGPKDLVTEADAAAQRLVQDLVLSACPDHGFLGEEAGGSHQSDAPWQWIVDPLDGTVNYVHRLPFFCVSVGLAYRGAIQCGVIHDPLRGICYQAKRGGGAWAVTWAGGVAGWGVGERKERTLKSSPTRRLDQALVAGSLPAVVRADSRELTDFNQIVVASRAVRRLGSSALNLCYVADGIFDAFWGGDTKVWDIAAGVLIAQEAGACVTGIHGGPLNLAQPSVLAASTQDLHGEILTRLKAGVTG